MGPTDDNANIADTVSRKRKASSAHSDASQLTRIKAIKLEDTSDSFTSRSSSPETEILGGDQPGESNWFLGGLRNRPDDDERFLEQPELYDLVNAVAKRSGLNAGIIHEHYRGQDQLSYCKSLSGISMIDVPARVAFRPAVAIARGVRIGLGMNMTFAWGQENEHHANWLQVSFHSDTQIPKIMLRVCPPSIQDAKDDPEPTFVHIFATDLSRGVKDTIRLDTGKKVDLGKSQRKAIRPWLLDRVRRGLTTATHFCLSRVDRERDADARKSKPVIHGKATQSELDIMAKEAIDGRKDQPLHEQFLGFIHGNRIRELTLITGYDSENQSAEYPREATFCRYFGVIMALCNELGNLWAYRQQFPSISWKDAAFPFSTLLPPRWTITKWFPRSATTSGAQTNMPALAAE